MKLRPYLNLMAALSCVAVFAGDNGPGNNEEFMADIILPELRPVVVESNKVSSVEIETYRANTTDYVNPNQISRILLDEETSQFIVTLPGFQRSDDGTEQPDLVIRFQVRGDLPKEPQSRFIDDSNKAEAFQQLEVPFSYEYDFKVPSGVMKCQATGGKLAITSIQENIQYGPQRYDLLRIKIKHPIFNDSLKANRKWNKRRFTYSCPKMIKSSRWENFRTRDFDSGEVVPVEVLKRY